MGKVIVDNLEIYAHHGYFEIEQKVGRWFSISATVDVDFQKAANSGDLSNTVNYVEIVEIIQQEMAKPSKLIESVLERIFEATKATNPSITKMWLKILKHNPPILGKINAVGVEDERNW